MEKEKVVIERWHDHAIRGIVHLGEPVDCDLEIVLFKDTDRVEREVVLGRQSVLHLLRDMPDGADEWDIFELYPSGEILSERQRNKARRLGDTYLKILARLTGRRRRMIPIKLRAIVSTSCGLS